MKISKKTEHIKKGGGSKAAGYRFSTALRRNGPLEQMEQNSGGNILNFKQNPEMAGTYKRKKERCGSGYRLL
ncbi:MAG: hypothetical protein M0Z52_06925 [Actinomycetota bacterium]|nr:hypothetical protein [Actinomycetota bacterium]